MLKHWNNALAVDLHLREHVADAREVLQGVNKHRTAHKGPLSLPDVDQPLVGELLHGGADGSETHAEALGQLRVRTDAAVFSIILRKNFLAKLVCNLHMQGGYHILVHHARILRS